MTCYEHYPLRLVVLTLVELLPVAVVGLLLVAQLGWWSMIVYALVGGLGIILSLAWVCTRCRYYGKMCGLGLGRLSALGFRQCDEEEFGRQREQTIAWSLVGLALALPLVAGLFSFSASRALPGMALLIIYLGLLVAMALTHSTLVCGRCLMAKHGRCTLGRVAGYK